MFDGVFHYKTLTPIEIDCFTSLQVQMTLGSPLRGEGITYPKHNSQVHFYSDKLEQMNILIVRVNLGLKCERVGPPLRRHPTALITWIIRLVF